MAEVTLEGTLWIDLVDVYAWIESNGNNTEDAKLIRFSEEDDALFVEFDNKLTNKESIEIDGAEFWGWVIKNHLPKGLSSYESVFGVPTASVHDMVINFAAGSGSDPREWGVAPKCLREWKCKKIS